MDKETKRLDKITPGMLHPSEPPMLYELGKKVTGRGAIVEIGSWKGRSTILITRGAVFGNKLRKKDPQVFAVDTFKQTEDWVEGCIEEDMDTWAEGSTDYDINTLSYFQSNIKRAGVNEYITPLKGRSSEVVKQFNKPIELIFIDGGHDYQSVLEDIENWCPKIIKGGWVAFHDSDYKGVIKAFKEKILNSKEYSNVGFCGSILYAQKVPGSIFKKRLVMLHRKILISLWKDLPEPIKVLIRTPLGKQYNSAPFGEVAKGSMLHQIVLKQAEKRKLGK